MTSAALAAAGCHPDPVVAPSAAAAVALDVDPDVVPLIDAGEYLAGRVYVLGVEAASAEVEACRDEEGRRHVYLDARSSGVAALIQPARMVMDTVLDDVGLRPRSNFSDADVGGKLRRYDVRFVNGGYEYAYHRSTGTPVRQRIAVPDEPWVHDLLTGVLMLRGWHSTPGSQARFAAVLGRHLWLTEAVFGGPDVILRDEGPSPAVRMAGVTRKQHANPKLRETRRFEVWFSDDPARIPLRAKTESSFGDIWLEMLEYRRDEPRRCLERTRVIPLPTDPASPLTSPPPVAPPLPGAPPPTAVSPPIPGAPPPTVGAPPPG